VSASQDDKVVLNARGILVTRARFVVREEVLMLTDIATVKVKHFPRSRIIPSALIGLGGIFSFLIWSGIGITNPSGRAGQFLWSYVLVALGLVMMAAGIVLFLGRGYAQSSSTRWGAKLRPARLKTGISLKKSLLRLTKQLLPAIKRVHSECEIQYCGIA
jgi:hypothetical protein